MAATEVPKWGGSPWDLAGEMMEKEQEQEQEQDQEEVRPVSKARIGVNNAESIRRPPRTGWRSVCGRRQDMEDTFAIAHNFLSLPHRKGFSDLHFFGVYDGHGGSQVPKTLSESDQSLLCFSVFI